MQWEMQRGGWEESKYNLWLLEGRYEGDGDEPFASRSS